MSEIKKILACIRTADKRFNLINKKDRIAIGISGGKDSMLFFYALHLYSKFSFVDFKIVPIIIDLGFDNFNPKPIQDFIESFGYKLEIYEAKDVYKILLLNQKDKAHLPCSICSKMKKAIIDKAAKKFNCNKVAFAHHADDAIETLFLNEIKGGKIATFSPKMFLTKDEITFIRPLILVFENDISKTVKALNIPVLESTCPANKKTEREEIKILLNQLYRKYPEARQNFLNMISNYDNFQLWDEYEVRHIENSYITLKYCRNADDIQKILNYHSLSKLKCDYNYLIFLKEKIIGTFAYNLENNELILKTIYFKNKNMKKLYFEPVIKEIEVLLFEKYNPIILKTTAKLKYFKENYKKEGQYYVLPLSGKLSKILRKN